MSSNVVTQWSTVQGTLLLAVSLAPEQIGERIAAARKKKGWTQLQFALEANVSPSSITRWEGGKLPPIRELIRIADVLGVEPEEFVEPPAEDADLSDRLDRVEAELAGARGLLAQIATAVGVAVPDEAETEESRRAV